ncbi:MAG: hypothetical protein V3S84_04720, partial [Dehalococcoidales bacterium]
DQGQFAVSKQKYITAPEPPAGYGTNLVDVLRNRYYHDWIIETLVSATVFVNSPGPWSSGGMGCPGFNCQSS